VSKHQLALVRAFPIALERTGPRTLTGRLVPYNQATDVADPLPDGTHDIYREGFRPNAFATQATSTERGVIARIGLAHRHENGLGYLGPFVALRETDDGLYGDVSILRSKADDVEDLLANGVNELSIEFRVPQASGTEVDGDGTRWRVKAHLDGVALEPRGSYEQAQVLAYRAAVDEQAVAEAAAEELRVKAEAEAEAIVERRHRFEELARRADDVVERQRELAEQYGVQPLSQHRMT
jgi:HK97 family phage prohead protease